MLLLVMDEDQAMLLDQTTLLEDLASMSFGCCRPASESWISGKAAGWVKGWLPDVTMASVM